MIPIRGAQRTPSELTVFLGHIGNALIILLYDSLIELLAPLKLIMNIRKRADGRGGR